MFPRLANSGFKRLRHVEVWMGTARGARLALAFVLSLSTLALLADVRTKAFWFDEIVTVDVASLPSIGALWTALLGGADSQPIGYLAVTRVLAALPIDPHISFRLISIVAYVAAALAVFAMTSRRLGPSLGLIGALLLMVSPLRHAAIEARSYAALAGCVAVVAWAWMNVDRSRWYAAVLAVAIVATGLVHHFGVVAMACVVVAELVEFGVERRWRWRAWIPLALGLIPVAITIPVMLRFRAIFGRHFWSPATLGQISATYSSFVTVQGAPLAFVAVWTCATIAMARWVPRLDTVDDGVPAGPGFSVPEFVMIGVLALYPVWLVVPTWFIHAGYVTRYAAPGIVGLAAGSPWILGQVLSRSTIRTLAVALLLVVAWQEGRNAVGLVHGIRQPVTALDRLPQRVRDIAADPTEPPVVIASGIDYLPIEYYAGSERGRYVQIVKPETAIAVIGTDSVDLATIVLDRFVPLHVVDFDIFRAAHPVFYMYASRNEFSWWPRYLAATGHHLVLLEEGGDYGVYRVEMSTADSSRAR